MTERIEIMRGYRRTKFYVGPEGWSTERGSEKLEVKRSDFSIDLVFYEFEFLKGRYFYTDGLNETGEEFTVSDYETNSPIEGDRDERRVFDWNQLSEPDFADTDDLAAYRNCQAGSIMINCMSIND
jgi:hypothetical protein